MIKVSINTNGMKIRDKTFISININTPNFYDEVIWNQNQKPILK